MSKPAQSRRQLGNKLFQRQLFHGLSLNSNNSDYPYSKGKYHNCRNRGAPLVNVQRPVAQSCLKSPANTFLSTTLFGSSPN